MKATMCDDMPELISLYLDGEMDEVARSRVRRHTAHCALCGTLFQELQSVDTMFHNAPLQLAPVGFTERAVQAAFEASFRENLRVGMVTLIFGTVTLLGLLLWGNLGMVTTIAATLVSPDAFTGMDQWIPSFVESARVFWRVMISAVVTVGEVLAAPLAVTLMAGAVSAYLLAEILKRTRVQMTA